VCQTSPPWELGWQACVNCCKTTGQPEGLNDKDGVNGELTINFALANPIFSNLGGAGPYNADWGSLYWYSMFVTPAAATNDATCDCSSGVSFPSGSPYSWMNALSANGECAMNAGFDPAFGGVADDKPFPASGCPEHASGALACCSIVDPGVVAYPDQPPVMRFSNVGALMETKIDYVLEEVIAGEYLAQFDAHPSDSIKVKRGLANNVADAGGIVAVNLPAPGEVSVKVGIKGSCCSRLTCRECLLNITDAACRYWEDGAPGCHPECLPADPVINRINAFCCCFGIDTFPLDYMAMCNDEISPFFSPRIDGGFRDRYLEQRTQPGFENTTRQECDSSHVRAVNRWTQFRDSVESALDICNSGPTDFAALSASLQVFCQSGLLERMQPKMPPSILNYGRGEHVPHWDEKPLTDVMTLSLPGFIPWGLTLRNRLFDFDRGGPPLRYLEEVTIYSTDFNLLYWRYPESYDTCVTEYDSVNVQRTSPRAALSDLSPQGACCRVTNNQDVGDFGTEDMIVRYSDPLGTSSVDDPTNPVYASSDGILHYLDGTFSPSERNWLPDDQTHSYSGFVVTDDCCGCINTCGASGALPCCARYQAPPHNLFVAGDVVDTACTTKCDVYDQYDTNTLVPFLAGFGSFYANDTLLVATEIQVPGRQPIDIRPLHSVTLLPGQSLPGNWELRLRANSQGGSENNVRSVIDPDSVVAPYGTDDNLIYDPITGEVWGVYKGLAENPGRCQIATRMVDVVYAINSATSSGVQLKFKMSSCVALNAAERATSPPTRNSCPGYPDGGGYAEYGRNVLFTSDSISPLCVPSECEARQACRFHSDCPSNDGNPRFCARSCISGDCPKVGENTAQFMGRPDEHGVSGFGVCQDCWDCVYDDEIYPVQGLSAGENKCARICAVISQAEAGGFAPYGLCPSCNQVATLMTAYVDGSISSNSYIPVADSVNMAYRRCATSADCGDPALYCSVQCETGVSSLAPKPGLSEQCNAFSGTARSAGGWGFCQPCVTGCSSFLSIRDNYDDDGILIPSSLGGITSCPGVCGLVCPRCFQDQLCNGVNVPSARGHNGNLVERGYPFEPTDSEPYDYNYFQVGGSVPTGGWQPLRQLGYNSANFGPSPRSGCWEAGPNATALFEQVTTDFQLPAGRNNPQIVCPCLSSYPSGVSLNGAGNLVVEISSVTYEYPGDYGLTSCRNQDDTLAPSCDGSVNPKPGWCTQAWCYVDMLDCNVNSAASSYIPGIDLYYSYEACA